MLKLYHQRCESDTFTWKYQYQCINDTVLKERKLVVSKMKTSVSVKSSVNFIRKLPYSHFRSKIKRSENGSFWKFPTGPICTYSVEIYFYKTAPGLIQLVLISLMIHNIPQQLK